VIVEQILILATYPTAEGDKQLTKHMSQWASHNGRYQVFENSRGEVVPYRKGYEMNLI